jgi:hypothetical protein
MLDRFRFFSKKITFNFVLVTVLHMFFQLGELNCSFPWLGSPDGYDSDKCEEGMIKDFLLKNPLQNQQKEHADPKAKSFLSSCDYSGDDINREPDSSKCAMVALSSPSSKGPFVFRKPTVSTKRSSFVITDSRSNKVSSKELTDLSWRVGPQAPARSYTRTRSQPSILANCRDDISKQGVALASAVAVSEKKEQPRVGKGFTSDMPLIINRSSQGRPRSVSFIGSSLEIDKELDDCHCRRRSDLLSAIKLDSKLSQEDSD